MRIKVNIRPKDGRYFLEKDGTKFSSATWAGVIKRVTMYRKLNKFPLGNVEEDVMNQACQRLPSLCYNEGTQQAYPKKPPPSLKGRVMGWLAKLALQDFSCLRGSEEGSSPRRGVHTLPSARPDGKRVCDMQGDGKRAQSGQSARPEGRSTAHVLQCARNG
jgi:hypothetical protein